MYKGVAVFSETVKTDSRLTVFGLVSAVEMKNSLENLCRIQLINNVNTTKKYANDKYKEQKHP